MSEDAILGILFGSLCGLALLTGAALLVVGTVMKMRFGINFSQAYCGECGKAAPAVRKPKTSYEVLWGGWTCPKCGCQNDKWGNPL